MKQKSCDYCRTPFTPRRPQQRFCNVPGKNCRQKWHQEHAALPGKVKGIRAVKEGWSVTIHFPSQPSVKMGTPVRIETTPPPRPDASTGEKS